VTPPRAPGGGGGGGAMMYVFAAINRSIYTD
jgi:hypothetical protein